MLIYDSLLQKITTLTEVPYTPYIVLILSLSDSQVPNT